MNRPVVPPPTIQGFEFIDILGSGGYADVYLYEQQMPRRRVAVKVQRSQGITDSLAAQFTAEANHMAALSAHPYIVTIFGAHVADDGRPYLVMEYYPGLNLSARCRQKPLGVPEALRIGVQIAGAVETAHRSGILHRDLKPANVLTSAFGKPGLTDFGISAVKAEGLEAGGVSIPWSPPELLDDSGEADERSDVYSLAATSYTLLAGRSPFESPSGDNSALALMSRIERDPVPKLGRGDVPVSFERALAAALSKSPDGRPASSADLARSLQSVERELHLQPTDLDVPDEAPILPVTDWSPQSPGAVDEDGTRLRGAVSIDAQPAAPSQWRPPPAVSPSAPVTAVPPSVVPPATAPAAAPGYDDAGATVRRGRHSDVASDGTVLRPQTVDERPIYASAPVPPRVEEQSGSTPRAPRRGVVLAVAGLVALAAVGIGVVALAGRGGGSDAGSSKPTATYDPNGSDAVASPPVGLRAARQGATVTFSWDAPKDAGSFTCERDQDGVPKRVSGLSCSYSGVSAGTKVCVTVQHWLNGNGSAEPATKCDPA